MNLHRAAIPDWEKCEHSELTRTQKIAKYTGGIVTPGNVITLLGATIAVSGLIDIKNGDTKKGTFKLGVGRVFDILDGFVADKTGTKSPVGEFADASVDKLVTLATLRVMRKRGIISELTYKHILGQNVANTAITAVATLIGAEVHPSKSGKHAMAAQGMVLGLNSLAMVSEEDGDFEKAADLRTGAMVFELIAAYKGARATRGYANDLIPSE